MKRFFAGLSFVALACAPSAGAQRALKVSVVSGTTTTAQDDSVRSVFQKMVDDLQDSIPDFPYVGVDLIHFDRDSECALIERDAVATVPPVKFLTCRNTLKETPIPLFLLKKSNAAAAYYPAYFAASVSSPILDLRSSRIRRIYLVSKQSASGYVAPIWYLWQTGVIERPNLASLQEKWQVVLVGDHREALGRVKEDGFAIAGVGTFPGVDSPADSELKQLLTYDRIPQDPLVISSNLGRYREQIRRWFERLYLVRDGRYTDPLASVLAQSSARITGLELFNPTHELEFEQLQTRLDSLEARPVQPKSGVRVSENVMIAVISMLSGIAIASIGAYATIRSSRAKN